MEEKRDKMWGWKIQPQNIVTFKVGDNTYYRDAREEGKLIVEDLFPVEGSSDVVSLDSLLGEGILEEEHANNIIKQLLDEERIEFTKAQRQTLKNKLKVVPRVELVNESSFKQLVSIVCGLLDKRNNSDSPELQFKFLAENLPKSEFIIRNKMRLAEIPFPTTDVMGKRRIDYPKNLQSFMACMESKKECKAVYKDSQNYAVDLVEFVVGLHRKHFPKTPPPFLNYENDQSVRWHQINCAGVRTKATQRRRGDKDKKRKKCNAMVSSGRHKRRCKVPVEDTKLYCHIHKKEGVSS